MAKVTERLVAAFNRADELGGEVRDFLQDKVATDPRYIAVRKKVASALGRDFESKVEATAKHVHAEQARAAAAATTPVAAVGTKPAGLGREDIKAEIFGKKSCPWTGRAITLLEKHKVDFDYINLEEPEYEKYLPQLAEQTKQHTVPYVFLRGKFIGGYNALAEVERLGQLEAALMSAAERAAAPSHVRMVEIASRPNTDEVAPADVDASDDVTRS